jgi:protein-S-isoprenylcysteine O-methyltransferase Ste14
MYVRLFLSIIVQYYFQIIYIDPTSGTEMGRLTGDRIYSSGNEITTFTKKLINTTWSFSLLLLSLYYNLETPLSMLDYIYFTLASIGVAGCFWIYRALGKFYTFTIGIRENHKLVTDGPYAYIMHPGYSNQILFMVSGLCFFNISIYVTLIFLVYVFDVYKKRIIEEENMLQKEFGSEFDSFKSTRSRLIPFIF